MINILFEDNHLLVVEKPINMPVCEDESKDIDLLTTLKKYLKDKYNKPGNVYLGLVHRLDRPVGGVMVFAKTSKTASRLSEQIRLHQFKKEYFAVIIGKTKENIGTYHDFMIKNKKENISYIDKMGKEAILDYTLIKYNKKEKMSLVKINLKTGRSHQIRLQFSYHGNPLYGDQKYNKLSKIKEKIALFAQKITFFHPISKKLITFQLDLPNYYPWNVFK